MNHCNHFYTAMRQTTGAPSMLSTELMLGGYLIKAKDGSFIKEINAHCNWCAKTKACKLWKEKMKACKLWSDKQEKQMSDLTVIKKSYISAGSCHFCSRWKDFKRSKRPYKYVYVIEGCSIQVRFCPECADQVKNKIIGLN